MKELENITKIATGMRKVLEDILLNSGNKKETSGVCLYASVLLSTALNNFANASCVIHGGGPEENAGLKDLNGVFRGHYWVEGTTKNGTTFIADISADQFGYPPVVIVEKEEGNVRYISGNHDLVKEHVAEELANILEYSRD